MTGFCPGNHQKNTHEITHYRRFLGIKQLILGLLGPQMAVFKTKWGVFGKYLGIFKEFEAEKSKFLNQNI